MCCVFVFMQGFAQYYLKKSSTYEADTTDELLKGKLWLHKQLFTIAELMQFLSKLRHTLNTRSLKICQMLL